MQVWIPWLGFAATMLLVVVGLLNFSVFRRQLSIAQVQIDTALRHLEMVQREPDLHLIQRSIAQTTEHVRILVDRPYLRPYFYDGAEWHEALRDLLARWFDRFPFTGVTMLCLKNDSRAAVEAELNQLIAAEGIDASEVARRRELLEVFHRNEDATAIQFTALMMQRRR